MFMTFLIHFIMTKTKMLLWCNNEVSRATPVVFDNGSPAVGGPSGGLSIRTCGEATMGGGMGHLDYKYWEFVRTVWEFQFGQGNFLTYHRAGRTTGGAGPLVNPRHVFPLNFVVTWGEGDATKLNSHLGTGAVFLLHVGHRLMPWLEVCGPALLWWFLSL